MVTFHPGSKLRVARSAALLAVGICLVWLAFTIWVPFGHLPPMAQGDGPDSPVTADRPDFDWAGIVTAVAGLITAIAGLLGAITGLIAVRAKEALQQQAASAPTPPTT